MKDITIPLDALQELKYAAAYGTTYNLSSVEVSTRALYKIIDYVNSKIYKERAEQFDNDYYTYRKKQLEEDIEQLEEELKNISSMNLLKFIPQTYPASCFCEMEYKK